LSTLDGRERLCENGFGKSIDFSGRQLPAGTYLIKATSGLGDIISKVTVTR
jgi:hypothetical protein